MELGAKPSGKAPERVPDKAPGKAPATVKMSGKVFFNKVLSGTATGVIIGLIPNAVLSAILKYFDQFALANTVIHIAVIFQLATPLIIGGLIALQFGLNPMQMMVTAGACFVSSGVVSFNAKSQLYIGAGTGDLINTMITGALSVFVLLLLKDKLGSTAVVLMPILVGCGVALVGVSILPFVAKITTAIGVVIMKFTTLQPILMAILISCSFATIIISPISTVAIGLAIHLNSISAGAAAMGVAATTIALVVNSWRVNKSGVTIAIGLGAMKMMMPNLFKYPIILIPCLFTAIVSAIPVAIFHIAGTAASSGFGLVGLVGPLASMDIGLSVPLVIICWLVIPIAAALLGKFLFEKALHLYDAKVIFKFQG